MRRKGERNADARGTAQDGAAVRKGRKAVFPVIAAHAGLPHPAERQVRVDELPDGIVDARPARRSAAQDAFGCGAVLAEHIESERFFVRVDVGDRLLLRVVREHGQERPEQLFAHAGGASDLPRAEQRRLDIALRLVDRAAVHDRFRILLQDHAEAAHLPPVHDPPVIGARLRVRAVKAADRRLHLLQERGEHAPVHKNVIGRDAGLPRVEELAPGDALARGAQLCRSVHDDGAFAAEFKGDGGQMLRRGAHDDPAHARTARKKDRIEAGAQQRRAVFGAAFGAGNVFLSEGLRDQPAQSGRRARRTLRRAEHRAVACGDRRHERLQQQLHGVIERADDERTAIGSAFDAALCGEHRQRRAHADGLHPAFQVFQRMRDARQHEPDLGQPALRTAFAQVRRERLFQRGLPPQERLPQFFQLRPPERIGERLPFRKKSALFCKERLHRSVRQCTHTIRSVLFFGVCALSLILHRRRPVHSFCAPQKSSGRSAALSARGSALLFCRLVHAAQRVEAARIADVRQTLQNDFDEKFPAVADAHVRRRMRRKLRFAPALRRQKTEGDHLAAAQVQPAAGVIVAETVVDQPFVDLPVLLPLFRKAAHALAEDGDLRPLARGEAVLRARVRLPFERELYAVRGKDLVRRKQKGVHPADAEIGDRLVDGLLRLDGRHAEIERGGEHHFEFVEPLAADERRQDRQKARFFAEIVAVHDLVEGKIAEQLRKFRIHFRERIAAVREQAVQVCFCVFGQFHSASSF